jgi:hypothetical protein
MRKNIFMSLLTATLIFITSTQSFAQVISQNDDESVYEGNSGNRYQYDRNNPSDELRYSIDLEAQRRDQMSLDTGTTLDRGMGQVGGGIYDDDDKY